MTVSYKIGDEDTRPWGHWKTIDVGEKHVVKRITVLPNQTLSLQKHAFRSEHWIIVSGLAEVTLGTQIFSAQENQHIYIPVGEIHRIANKSSSLLTFIEVQTGEILDENDITRLEDVYGRQ